MADKSVALVTGASRGIGKAVALELAGLDYNLAVSYFDFGPDGQPDEAPAKQTQREIKALGVECEIIRSNIADSGDRRDLVSFVKDKFGRCDLLINNAGVAPSKRVDLLDAGEESYDRVMDINLKGPYFLTQLIANWMVGQATDFSDREYRIVNMASLSSYAASPARGEYCLSKAGVSMMTMLYADRLAEYGIGVFEVRPGIIMTDMTSVVKDKYDKLIAEGLTPIKRWGQPEDVARAIAAIAQGSLDFSTGQVINVDGGFHLRRV